MAMTARNADGRLHHATAQKGRAILDRAARRYLQMSGDEFVRAWDVGQFDDDPDRPEVIRVAMLLPFAR